MECSWVKPLSSKEMDELIEIEHDRSISIEGLMAWRNIADAQIDKEREKYDEKQKSKEQPKKSYYSYLFGSSTFEDTAAEEKTESSDENKDDDVAAIVLSNDEMRELEDMAKVDFKENDLSKDSKLYDVEFIMRAFKVDLVAYDLRHVSSLDMGQVSMGFDAVMDGAYQFDFELSDLEIFDRTTPQSIFPSVLRMIENPSEQKHTKAFQFKLAKTSTGDQSLSLQVATFEAVASQLLIQELRRFFQDSPHKATLGKYRKANPLLAQSVSGSVDLFYDAVPGDSFVRPQPPLVSPQETADSTKRAHLLTRYDLSNALVDAWKEKTETRVSWLIDIDVNAPVLLVPETCNDPRANVLVFDFGNLRVKYGKFKPSTQVQQWFDENPRETLNEESYDSGTMSVSDLTFSVQKARVWQSRSSLNSESLARESAIIDPTGINIDFAIETIGSEGSPRVCLLGVIPTISLRFSPVQSTRIFPVINSWKDVFREDGKAIGPDTVEDVSSDSSSIRLKELESDASDQTVEKNADGLSSSAEPYGIFYCRLGLQHLSLNLMEDDRSQLEAHLVSVYASMSQSSDGSSSSGLQMGWFWILDWLQSDFERRQRLVVHSNLPKSAQFFSESNNYDIIDELQKQGVFKKEYSGSADLADVSYKTLPGNVVVPDAGADVESGKILSEASSVQSVLDVKFHSLFIHWNPRTIKGINNLIGRFMTATDDATSDTGTLIMPPEKSKSRKSKKTANPGRLLIKAEMESLCVILNSALDDLPLFTLTVSETRVSLIPRGLGKEISLSLGDVRVATPENLGQTLPSYRTLLGLASDRSKSLLTVQYCMGQEAVASMDLPPNKKEGMEAIAAVELSPMRFCFINSQTMTLVEYITDGILGALTAQAATTAAEAAKELANSVSGGSLFVVRASSLDLVLPQAAYREHHLGMNTNSLDVEFYMFNDSRGSCAKAMLSDVMLRDTSSNKLQKSPVQMSVDLKIPPYDVGSMDDQAMIVAIDISESSFILTKNQYKQIMDTLDENIGDTSLFLRDEEFGGLTVQTAEGTNRVELTHAGAEFVERTRRLYFTVGIKELSLALQGRYLEDSIVKLRAVNALVSLSQYPDLEKSITRVSLQNLFCEDRRPIAEFRQYRYLIDQTSQTENSENKNIFQIEYTSEKGKSNLDFALGSPQVVLIPDVISEIKAFVSTQKASGQGDARTSTYSVNEEEKKGAPLLNHQVVQVDQSGNGEVFETHLRSANTFVTSITVKTGTCQFVLVDLGSQLTADKEAAGGESTRSVASSTPQLTETVVLQGIFSAAWASESDLDSEVTISSEFQGHSDGMEIFTAFGRERRSPLQILEPAEASVHGSLKTIGPGETEIEVRAAALTPMDFSLSMHNVALFNAISSSLNECFLYEEYREAVAEAEDLALTPKEQQRIENLATALEKITTDDSISYHESGSSLGDSVASTSVHYTDHASQTTRKTQIKMTMPQATVTVINDLQGSDEALFRVSVTNFVAGGEMVSPTTLFDFHCNTSILADYFDTSVNLWNRLLIKPWEITMKGSRAPSRRFKSNRLSSTLDLESFPCCISFSEQFLVSLASASRMWSIYTAAINGPADHNPGSSESAKSSMTASAARNLITSFPYAVANHCGMDVSFSLKGGSIGERSCPTGNAQYFRFDPPKGLGYGGRRAYGQDVEMQKLVEIVLEDNLIAVNMDVELGLPPCGHDIGENRVLFTQVIKEGKTTVSISDYETYFARLENTTRVIF